MIKSTDRSGYRQYRPVLVRVPCSLGGHDSWVLAWLSVSTSDHVRMQCMLVVRWTEVYAHRIVIGLPVNKQRHPGGLAQLKKFTVTHTVGNPIASPVKNVQLLIWCWTDQSPTAIYMALGLITNLRLFED